MRLHHLLLSAILSLVAFHLQAQNGTDAQRNGPVLKTTTRAVVVDVLVTGSGSPVTGLQQRDFTVLEDGKPQTIDFFELHTFSSAPAELPALPPHVFTNQPPTATNNALNVLLLDSLNTEPEFQANAHKQTEGLIANLKPGIRVAIYMLDSRLKLLQGFTADTTLLKAAVNSKDAAPRKSMSERSRQDELSDKEDVSIAGDPQSAAAEARSLGEFANTQRGQQASITLTALQALARSLAAIPGRKNLIWFASTFPVALYPEGDDRHALQGFQGHELPDALRQTVDLLTEARVALYPVSARGLMGDRAMNADSSGQPNGDNFEQNPYKESPAIRATTAMMDQLATNTGGQAIYTTNDVGAALTEDILNGALYYTIAYTPSNEKMDGSFRRIEVKLPEGKYKLAYRRGYYADAGPVEAKTVSDALAPLLADGMPDATQIVYRARVTPEAKPPAGIGRAGGNAKLTGPVMRYKVEFLIPAESVIFASTQNGTRDAKIRVAIVAYGRDGKPVNWTGGELALSLNEASYAKAQRTGIATPMEIDLPQAELSLATGIWDTNAQRAGTLRVAVNPKTDAIEMPASQ